MRLFLNLKGEDYNAFMALHKVSLQWMGEERGSCGGGVQQHVVGQMQKVSVKFKCGYGLLHPAEVRCPA